MKVGVAENERKIAWGITGCGDRLTETIGVMKEIKKCYNNKVEIEVYLSKSGEQVVKWYKLNDQLHQSFNKVWVEFGANSPFLAGDLELGKFEFLLIAPSTSNTVAKIVTGIADTLLCNSAIMALKSFTPVYIMPCDYEEGKIITRLPNGKLFELRVRKEDAENTKRLSRMDGVFVLKKPEEIHEVFNKHLNQKKA